MAVVKCTSASLRFFGDDLGPEELTRLLGTSPTRSFRKGERMQLPPLPGPIARTSTWQLRSEREPEDALEGQIIALLQRLSTDLQVWRDLTLRYRVDVFCGVWMDGGNQMFGLSPRVLKLLGDRGLEIEFDMYYEGSEAEPS